MASLLCVSMLVCASPLAMLLAAQAGPSAAAVAKKLENPASAVFRYRVHITNLLQLKPGMTAAEIGAGSGFVSRLMAERVGSEGRITATDLDPKMVDYINARAKQEGLSNLTAVAGEPAATGLAPESMDAIALVARLGTFAKPEAMLASITATLKPKGLLLVVDSPREGQGTTATGIDAEQVIALATAAGLDRVDENNTVPGHFALRFRKR
jgi:ubiquinone/menaquinone biosynthesis C-methylase UbiE